MVDVLFNSEVSPLAHNVPIVDEKGNPTPYFQTVIATWLKEKKITEDQLFGLGLDGLSDVDTVSSPPTDGQVLTWDDSAGFWVPETPISPNAGALTLINHSLVVGSSAANINFSSIPSTYKDLVIVINGRGTTAATNVTIKLRMNGDTGNNYDWEQDNRFGATNGQGVAFANCASISASTSPAGATGVYNLQIPDYAQTVFHKQFFVDGAFKQTAGANNFFRNNFQGAWRNTAAITSLDLFPTTGNWDIGSHVSLYGRG